ATATEPAATPPATCSTVVSIARGNAKPTTATLCGISRTALRARIGCATVPGAAAGSSLRCGTWRSRRRRTVRTMRERTATCRACGRPIAFVRTPRGKLLPVDLEPVLVVRRGPGTVTVVTASGEVIRGYRTDEPPDPEIGAHAGRI